MASNLRDITSYKWLIKKINDDVILKHSHLFKGKVYDLGCGNKPYIELIKKSASEYIGVDWAETLHNKVMDVVANLNNPLDIAENSADTVVSFQVMEHLSEPQIFLKEAERILKPGGLIFLTVPFQHHIHEDPYDFFRYTKYGLEYLMKKAGFIQINIKPIYGYWVNAANKFSYQSTRWIKGPKIVKYPMSALLILIRFIIQRLSFILDNIDYNERETTGYYVIAYKNGEK